ncbi:MAG: undecaprenyl/decaprenyl-phosphate alpha-N-acetylglucosaminyl 1-phosphate transferase [Sedimentisphaerales bacterium]|nr:undecaprenyl/decaprenyl-phosphate alpha-N-acetylglucosaminyl 1-phosphate transferase [Sedimentisphaerales bacterium]
MSTFLFAYVLALGLVLCITPLIIHIAHRLRLYDDPDNRKIHTNPVPRVGGISLFMAIMILSVWMIHTCQIPSHALRTSAKVDIYHILLGSLLIFMIGLWDDINGLRARTKFILQLIIASAIYGMGVRITEIPLTEQLSLKLYWISCPVTLLWIVGITNAVNLSDGLDGLVSGLVCIAAISLGILSFYCGNIPLAILMITITGAATGFLFFNFHPARIFLGDCGSLLLGFLLAGGSTLCMARARTFAHFILPLAVLGLPLFDMLFCMLRRFIERRSIFSPDRSHFHHRLLAIGFHHRQAVLLCWLTSLTGIGISAIMFLVSFEGILLSFVAFGIMYVTIFRKVGAIRLRETLAGLRQNYARAMQVKEEIARFEEVELDFRRVCTFQDWWNAVCRAAQYMNFAELTLTTERRDGTPLTLTWIHPKQKTPLHAYITLMVPIQDARAASSLQISVKIIIGESLEQGARCVTLFSRLIEQYRFTSIQENQIIPHDSSSYDPRTELQDEPCVVGLAG